MAVKVTVRVGGDSGATLVNYTAQVPAFGEDSNPLYQAGMQCNNGSACQYQFTVHDDVGEIPRANLTKNLASHNQVTISEDGPGFDAWLSRGRIADKGWGRGDKPWGDARSADVTVDDANTDMRGLALLTDWVRGAESGRARVLAMLSAFLNGSPRLTTVLSTHLVATGGEVTMPAKTYPAGTELPEIAEDCAGVEGKIWSVVIHHLASVSHLCFLYIDDGDHTTYLSTLSITDNSPNLTTSFPPIWDQGDASIESGGDNPISHIVSRYGQDDSSFVVKTDPTITTAYDYWAVPYNDSVSVSPTEAGHRAQSTLVSRGKEHVTHQVTIKLRADQVHLLCAGMSIVIRAVASMGGQYLGTNQTRRIAQLKWELVGPDVAAVDGFYLAHMQLDRPQKQLAQGKGLPVGPKPAGTSTPTPVDYGVNTTSGSEALSWSLTGTGTGGKDLTIADTDTALYVFVLHRHDDGTPTPVWRLPGPVDQAFTQLATQGSNGATGTMDLFRLLSPTAGTGQVLVANGASTRAGGFYLTGVNQTTPEASVDTDNPIAITSAGVAVAGGQQYLDAAGMVNAGEASVANPTPSGAQTQAWAVSLDSGADDHEFGGSYGDATPVWTSAASRRWAAAAVAVNGTGGGTGTVDGTGSASPGAAGTYIPAGSVLEHASITTGGPYHMAEDLTAADAGGFYAGTTVETQLQEVRDLNARVGVRKNSAGSTFTRRRVNLIEGSNVTLTVADDSGNEEVDVTIAATGGGGSLTVEEVDGTPSVASVSEIIVSNGTLTDNGGGSVTLVTGAGGGSAALTLLSHTVLGSAAADITATGLSGSYKDLVIVVRGRSTDAGAGIGLDIRVGSGSIDTGSNYSYQQTYVGWASGNNSGTGATSARIGSIPNSGATAGSFGVCIIEIINYADTAKWRGWVGQAFAHDGSGVLRSEVGGFWKNAAAALDQVRVLGSAGNLDTGSALTIYGRG